MASQAVAVTKMDVRSMDTPDERRTPDKTTVDVVNVEGMSLARLTFQPGWRWSECVKPAVGTDSCQVSHIGYAVQGRIGVQLGSGEKATIAAGSAYAIPPGHDAWVEGNEPFVGLEVLSAAQYAKA